LCPVLDISFNNEADNSLRGRCYGKTVGQVIRNATAFNYAMRALGIASCGKHFPGYSAATVDAHHDLPKIERTRADLDKEELAVFRAFTGSDRSPNGHPSEQDVVDSMMICHGWYPCFEQQKKPASLSKTVITDLLRNEMGFEGLIMTDDLDMGAILNEYSLEDTLRLALEAGNDLAMICHRIEEIENAYRILSALPTPQIDRALQSINRFKQALAPPDPFSESEFDKLNQEIWDLRVATLGDEQARLRSAEDGKRSPVELY
jgi:beta-N-acetylhexosaminidase